MSPKRYNSCLGSKLCPASKSGLEVPGLEPSRTDPCTGFCPSRLCLSSQKRSLFPNTGKGTIYPVSLSPLASPWKGWAGGKQQGWAEELFVPGAHHLLLPTRVAVAMCVSGGVCSHRNAQSPRKPPFYRASRNWAPLWELSSRSSSRGGSSRVANLSTGYDR